MEKTIENPSNGSVVYAMLVRRLTAFIFDALIAFGLGMIIYYALGNTLIAGARQEPEKRQEVTSFINDAGIVDSNGYAFNYQPLTDDGGYGYEKLENMVWRYYTVFVARDERAAFLDSDGFTGNPTSNEDVGKWIYAHIYHLDNESAVNTDLQPYYTYPTPINYTVKPVLNESIAAELETDKTTTAARKLLLYWSTLSADTTSPKGPYIDTFYHIQKQAYYIERASDIQLTTYLKTLPSFIAAPFIVLAIFPLFFKYGQTPAKLIMRLGVVSADGYRAKKWQILIHGSVLSLYFMVLALPFGQLFTMLGVMLLVALDILMIRIAKKGQTLHELASFTRVAELRGSTIYKNHDEELAASSPVSINPQESAIDVEAEEKK